MTTKLRNFINGEFVAPIEGQYIENINPANGEVISLVPDSNHLDVNKAVAAAKDALAHPDWNHQFVTPRRRADWLKKIADGIEARLEEFAQAESRDTGTVYHVEGSDSPFLAH
ncbi:aldehyde dehydrogenase family protein [archaeon]|nr:MAG: aldehyde dehydrogenase family protein [archaeon]